MKKLFMAFLLIPFMVFAQTEHYGELIITLINQGPSWNVTFKLEAIGVRWDRNFELTGDYEIVTNNIQSPWHYVAYFDHVWDIGTSVYPIFAFGLYKISAIENGVEQASFYMDWRTSDANPFGDVKFKYDVANNRFRDENDTQTIDKTYQTIWNLLGPIGSTLQTSGFEDYWDNSLALIPSVNNNPRLVWGPYPSSSMSIQAYQVYRKYGSSPFAPCTTLSANSFQFTDESVFLSIPGGQVGTEVSYYITAIYNTSYETTQTNLVSANVQGGEVEKNRNSYININDYNLQQNYPNPFNPNTIISWTSPIDEFVTLKVYDVLGREVVTLVNEYQNAGLHSIRFNAQELSSGVYIYRIQIGEYMKARSLMIQK